MAAQNDFLALHLNREHFGQEVSNALREDLGRNGFTLESVTITELTQTPLSELRSDDIFGASGRETVTNTVVEKNVAVKCKMQEEAERSAEIAREQEINVAQQTRIMREGKAKEDEAAAKAELAKSEAIETRDLQRQANIAVERARKEQAEQAAAIGKQKVVEAAQVDKEKTIEAAQVDKQITLTLKAKESAEADAQKAAFRKRLEAEAMAAAADMQAVSITKLAEANREAGLKEAEVLREKNAAANSKSKEILLQEAVLSLIQSAPAMLRELVKPAEKIAEIKVLQVGGALGGGAGAAGGAGAGAQLPLLGGALGPVTKSIIEASAVLPMLKEVMKFTDADKLKTAFAEMGQAAVPAPAVARAGRVTPNG